MRKKPGRGQQARELEAPEETRLAPSSEPPKPQPEAQTQAVLSTDHTQVVVELQSDGLSSASILATPLHQMSERNSFEGYQAGHHSQGAGMRTVNFVLQGKGGVGKSFIASLLAQHYLRLKAPVVCVDTDPVNATLSGYTSFKARRVELLQENRISERRFDEMMEWILGEDAEFVVDNGASVFLPLTNYLLENDAIRMITAQKKQVIVHTVITGGQALMDTLLGLEAVASSMPTEAQITVWLNEFFGPIVADGKTFEQMAVYQKHKARLANVVRIPRQTSDTFGKDMELMLHERLTFAEAITGPKFSLMAKQRLTMMGEMIFSQMDGAAGMRAHG
jgi:hypothetical protein